MRDTCNRARGEVLLEVDGQEVRLCLTLGALAELEAAFDVVSLTELGERLAHLSASDLILVLAALARGGGAAIGATDLAAARIDPRAAAHAVAACFQRALDD